MNKSELADRLAMRAGITKDKASDIVDHIFSTKPGEGIIAAELDAGRKVAISGFGTFSTRHQGSRMGRNPQTGAAIHIEARTVPKFAAAKGLKDRVYR